MVQLKWLGHSAWEIRTATHTILIDPLISGNPMNRISIDKFNPDYIILTHGHNDHVGDAITLAKTTGAIIISNHEIACYMAMQGIKSHGMHIGGAHQFPFGRVKLTQALHGSGYITESGIIYLGNPCGVVLSVDGKNIYHSGDTGLFSDMKLIGELDPLDAAIVPIGGNYTMDAHDAAIAVSFLKPKIAFPMHYNTWEVIESNPEVFKEEAKNKGVEVKILQPSEIYEL